MTLLILVLFLIIGAILFWLGHQWANGNLRDQRAAVVAERAALRSEWRSLEQTRQIREVFLNTSHAMRVEAMRHLHNPEGPR
jgi:hypothetical protein